MPFRPTEPTKKEKKVFCVLPGEDVHAHVDAHVDAHDDEDDEILYIVHIAFSEVLWCHDGLVIICVMILMLWY